jgi:hypothetical protein
MIIMISADFILTNHSDHNDLRSKNKRMKTTILFAGFLTVVIVNSQLLPAFIQKLSPLTGSGLTTVENHLPPSILNEAATRMPGQFSVLVLLGNNKTKNENTVRYLAHKTGEAVYRVDLAQLVSPSLLTTKKNLEIAFELARKQHGLLYFDEADALFGRRSPVKDAHDRYDTSAINYFFELVKKYRGGIVIGVYAENNINPLVFEKYVRLTVK